MDLSVLWPFFALNLNKAISGVTQGDGVPTFRADSNFDSDYLFSAPRFLLDNNYDF